MIYAAEAGWTHEERYGFNDAITGYVEKFEQMRDAVKEVPDHTRQPRRPKRTKRVPVHKPEDLMRYLHINPEHKKAQEIIRTTITDDAWNSFTEGEWVTEPESVPVDA